MEEPNLRSADGAPVTALAEFGVRYSAALDQATHVEPYTDEAAACRFLHALEFMGNTDGELVHLVGGTWVPMEVPR